MPLSLRGCVIALLNVPNPLKAVGCTLINPQISKNFQIIDVNNANSYLVLKQEKIKRFLLSVQLILRRLHIRSCVPSKCHLLFPVFPGSCAQNHLWQKFFSKKSLSRHTRTDSWQQVIAVENCQCQT